MRLRLPARRLPWFVLVTLVVFVAVAVSRQVQLADSDQPWTASAKVTIASDGPVTAVPPSYLGLSTEYWALPLYARHLTLFERILSMLHVPGGGPLILRVGGDSADYTFWDPRARTVPPWAFSLTPDWISPADQLVHRLGARLILDLNLITSSPATAASWIQAAESRFPRGSIVGIEIGNEPDIYNHAAWLAITAGKLVGGRALPQAVTADDYVADFRAYAAGLHEVAPGVPLLGPALANPRANERWIATLIASHQSALGGVSAHRYQYSACVRRGSASFPTVTRVLSETASAGMAASLVKSVRAAHRAGLPFRLTELNSVTCGGRPGVSDTFATALWAPDALFELLRDGVNGVNLHLRAHTINAPFALTSTGLVARPLLYGLTLFSRTLGGSHAQLVPLRLRADSSLHLAAWAVRTGGEALHVLLIDKGRRPVRVRLKLPGTGAAAIQRLLAPSVRSRDGVTLDGQRLRRNGRWQGAPSGESAGVSRLGYLVTMPGYSAALVSVRLAAR